MSFNEITGQKKSKNILSSQLKADKIPHAYIFIGPEGIGRKKTAYELAKSLNCTGEKKDGFDPCGECSSCQKISKNIHPDVQLIDFEWQARFENKDASKQKALKIDTIRALQKEVNLKPVESKWKTFIIEPAEKITIDAANCLLKTLEEPPSWTVMILLAIHKDNLPATVVSRTQIIPFTPLAEKDVAEFLNDKFSVPIDRAYEIAADSEGSLSTAISRINSEETEAGRIWQQLKQKELKTAELLKLSQENAKTAGEFLSGLLSCVKKDFRIQPKKYKPAVDSIINSGKLLESNCNAQMVLDVLLMKLI